MVNLVQGNVILAVFSILMHRTMSSHETSTLQDLKRKHLGEVQEEPTPKKKKAKNPNPLSCLKSKKAKKSAPQVKEEGKKKRKRHKRKKTTMHPASVTT